MFTRLKHLNNSSSSFASLLPCRTYKSAAAGYHGFKPCPPTQPTDQKKVDVSCAKTAQLRHVIQTYRELGFQSAKIDPLNIREVTDLKNMVQQAVVSEDELFNVSDMLNISSSEDMNLQAVVDMLEDRYCGHLSIELGHLYDSPEKEWCHKVIEDSSFYTASADEKKAICTHLMKAQLMEV